MMNSETHDDDSFVRLLKEVKRTTSKIRKLAGSSISSGNNSYVGTTEEGIITSKPLTSEYHPNIKGDRASIIKPSMQASVCSKATEKHTSLLKDGNVSENIHECSTLPVLNSKYYNGKKEGIHSKMKQEEIKKNELRTAISGRLQNLAKTDANENFKSDEESAMVHSLYNNLQRTNINDSYLDVVDDEELQDDKLIMVEIYRRISNFFEIILVTPAAMIIENHLDIFEFSLAIVVCTIYMWLTNAKKKFSKILSSKTKSKSSNTKKVSTPMTREDSNRITCLPVKTLDSVESLILFSSNENSREEINILHGCELGKNLNSKNGVKMGLEDDFNDPQYIKTETMPPKYNNQLAICENQQPKIIDLDEFDVLSLKKSEAESSYFHGETELAAKDDRVSPTESVNTPEGKVYANKYLTEISYLDLKYEPVGISTNVVEEETGDKLQTPHKEYSFGSMCWKHLDTIVNDIESLEFGDMLESNYSLSSMSEKEGSFVKTDNPFNISEFSQLSNNSLTEPGLLDFDVKQFQEVSQSNANRLGTSEESEQKHLIFIDNFEQDIFAENFETKFEIIDDTPLINNIHLDEKTADEHEKLFLDSPMTYLKELNDLDLFEKCEESQFETAPDGIEEEIKFESNCDENVNENERNTLRKILIDDTTIFETQENLQVMPLVPKISSELSDGPSNFDSITYGTENNKGASENTKVLTFTDETKIIADTVQKFEVGDNFTEIPLKNFDGNVMTNDTNEDENKATNENNNLTQLISNESCSKCYELSEKNACEDVVMEKMNNENITVEKEIDLSEYDLIEECETTVTTISYINEYFQSDDVLNLCRIRTPNVQKSNEIAKSRNGTLINENSYPIRHIERVENENSNKTCTQYKVPPILQYSQECDEALKRVNDFQRNIQDPQNMEIREELDAVMETRSCETIQITQEKSFKIHKIFSSSMPDVRDINVDELHSCYEDIPKNILNRLESSPNAFLPSDLDSSTQELLEPPYPIRPCREIMDRIEASLTKLPRIFPPADITNENFQSSPSNHSESFEVEAASSNSKIATDDLCSEAKGDRKKLKKGKSFKSKVFNGVRRFQDRLSTFAGEVSNYKKTKE